MTDKRTCLRDELRRKALLTQYGHLSAVDAFHEACYHECQSLQYSVMELGHYTFQSSCNDLLELAEIKDEQFKPHEVQLSNIQNLCIQKAKNFLKDAYWYKGIRIELLPETDEEILELGIPKVIDRLVKCTVYYDCPHIDDHIKSTVDKNEDVYIITYHRDEAVIDVSTYTL